MKKIILNIFKIIAVLYILICVLLYFFQEKLIFFPEKLAKNYKYKFTQNFEELNFNTADNKSLNGILFKSDSSKGLIFYLHGNAGSLKSWGQIAKTYTDLNYDLFMVDYRGYGKSDGEIKNEKQFYGDVQFVYDNLKNKYPENKIVILGYSIGTGPATKLASVNNSKLLILQAPYYSLKDMMQHNYKLVPAFILKYNFETNKFIKECKMPVLIFHGNADEVIYYQSSLKLKELFKKEDTLIILNGQSHNGMSENAEYKLEIEKILRD
ncbi:alpha/beta hydrolase [Ferruginibacter sp.]